MKWESQRKPGHWLHYVEAGDRANPTILLVHGATGDWYNFSKQIPVLAEHYHVLAIDQRGHGRSPWPGPSSMDDFYRDLEEILLWLDRPVTLVAHSFGGSISARLAAEHPDRVQRLALLNTCAVFPRGLSYRFMQLFASSADLLARPEGILTAGSEVCRHLLYRTIKDWDMRGYYARIKVPVLMIAGAWDPLVPFWVARSSANLLANCRFHVLPLSAHVAMWDSSPQVNSLLSAWLRETEAAPLPLP